MRSIVQLVLAVAVTASLAKPEDAPWTFPLPSLSLQISRPHPLVLLKGFLGGWKNENGTRWFDSVKRAGEGDESPNGGNDVEKPRRMKRKLAGLGDL
jgi:hypothetical protein